MYLYLIILSLFVSKSLQYQLCISGRYNFNTTGTYSSNWIIDYGHQNFFPLRNGGAYLSLNNPRKLNTPGSGIRISSKTDVLYAKMTVRARPIAIPGAVTTFITMSDSKDEIDVEWIGKEPTKPQSNIFYKGIPEYGLHFKRLQASSGIQNITIDWKSTSIQFSVDGKIQRTYLKNSPEAISPLTPPNQRWFPNTPSKIQISVWDTTGSAPGTQAWAGGPIPWNRMPSKLYAYYEYVDIQCYNDKDQVVYKWPK
jgi:beta-glucanase (GH16 family)